MIFLLVVRKSIVWKKRREQQKKMSLTIDKCHENRSATAAIPVKVGFVSLKLWRRFASYYGTGRRRLEPITASPRPAHNDPSIRVTRQTDDDVFFFRPDNYRGQETHRKSLQSQSAAGERWHWTRRVCIITGEGSSRKRNGTARWISLRV